MENDGIQEWQLPQPHYRLSLQLPGSFVSDQKVQVQAGKANEEPNGGSNT